jgi:CDP-diacylglycerol--glycerol-3-phosphate 3-phosphatidyltransferase
MTTANKITILRILLIPIFAVELIRYVCSGSETFQMLAVILFTVVAILDGVDGFVARFLNQKSELGTVLDPFADKMLFATGIIILGFHPQNFLTHIPPWFTGAIIGCDLMLLGGFLFIRGTIGKTVVRSRVIGKISTGFQMIIMLWILLKWNRYLNVQWFTLCAIGAAACAVLSALFYAWDGMKQLRAHAVNSGITKR